ncbi:flagellar hook-associated protein FlgK [Colwellia asteriadis]|uniref:Flagellar hook-associated protein 1 n=1 Tax=Colwellia asteriadis TaxID=517723 RepID=A0ABN1L6E5_9GAMM
MSVSLYQSGVSGLLASQQQLATTGHNIANVNTEGFNRQRAEQNATLGFQSGGNFIGTGTYIDNIARLYDQFSHKEQLLNQSNLGQADSLNGKLSQLDRLMSHSGEAVMGSINQLYQSINGVVDNPSDAGLRSIVLNQASVLSSNFNDLSNEFNNMTKAVNGEIDQVVNKISEISVELAKTNEAILYSQNLKETGQANDLLDKRDQLIGELSQYTSVNTIEDQHGVMTVMIGQGVTLVAGITPLTMQVNAGDPDPLKTELRLVGPNGSVAMSEQKLGGSLGASFEFRDEHLSQTKKDIDRLAMAISSTLNTNQASGLDLNGIQGANMFSDINTLQLQQGRVSSPSTNTGNLAAQVNITDISLLPAAEFEVRYDGTNYIMTNMSNGNTENLGAPGSGTYTPSSPDYGFEFIETSGAPVAGDVLTLQPTKDGAALFKTILNDGSAIAASSAVNVTPSTNNVSDGKVAITNVTDPAAARTFASTTNQGLLVDVYESSPGTFSYRVYDGDPNTPPPTPPSVVGAITSGTFLAGNSVVIDMPPAPATAAFQFEISGQPVGQGVLAPEKYTIGDAFGIGNGGNALSMAKTQTEKVINGGTESFSQNLAVSTATVGSKASNAELVSDTAQALYNQAYNRNQSISGVNLDEEAANLLKFQQAYQASSQIISVANTLFDTILAAVR